MKVGLVLEGGAMRGMFTAGVLDVFMEQGIQVDGVIGVSAGALFGVNYLSGQKGRVIRYNKRFNGDRRYMGLLPLLTEGNIVSTKYAYEDVPRMYDPFDGETYKKSKVPFYAVVTNVETGEPEYIQVTDVFEQMDVLRASGSMPFVSKPVEIDGKKYLDGGISDSIPFRWLRDQGYDRLIVILTRDIGYRKQPFSKLAAKQLRKKYPKIEKKMLLRHYNYNTSVVELKKLEREGEAFIIRPSAPIRINKIEKDPEKLQEVYDLGRNDALAAMENLKKYIGGCADESEKL